MHRVRGYDVFMAASDVFWDSDLPAVTRATMTSQIKERLVSAPKFIVDDVSQLYNHTQRQATEPIALNDQPPVAVPFDVFWVEWDVRHLLPATMQADTPVARRCVVCTVHALDDGRRQFDGSAFICYDIVGTPPMAALTGSFGLLLADDGRIEGAEAQNADQVAEESHDAESAAGIVVFALGLLSAKNVTRVEERMPRAFRRHPGPYSGTADHVHYTLDIPGAREFREALAAGAVSQRRLHIVRGHFADYSEGSGLFGKLHGRYYIAPHVRGNADRGTVTKDYNVTSP